MLITPKIASLSNRIVPLLPKNLERITLDILSMIPFAMRLPRVIMVEPTNVCNSACPLCPVGLKIDKRKKGFMQLDRFQQIVDDVKHFVEQIVMNFAGETLMHPKIGEMIRYATDSGIRMTIGTNGTIDKMNELAESGVHEVLYALDGASKETYDMYRKCRDGVGFEKVVENLRLLVKAKRAKGAQRPHIIVQFIVMRSNEHEIEAIQKLARDIGADGVDLKSVCLNNSEKMTEENLIKKYIPLQTKYSRYESHSTHLTRRQPAICSFIHDGCCIYHNGDLTICCYDYNGQYIVGNVLDDGGFRKVWSSKRYSKLRKQIVKRTLPLCRNCGITIKRTPSRIHMKRTLV